MVGYREVFDSIRLDAIRDLLADGIPKLKADTVSTDELYSKSRPHSATAWKDDNGDTVAIRPDTDDTYGPNADPASTLNPLIDDLHQDGGGTVECGPYEFTGVGADGTPIRLQGNVTFAGQGIGYDDSGSKAVTKLKLANGANINLVEYIPQDNSDNFFARIEDIYLDANRANNTSGHAFYSAKDGNGNEANDFHAKGVWFSKAADDGAHLDFSWGYRFTDVLFESNDGYGFNNDSGGQGKIDGCYAALNGLSGIRNNGKHWQIDGHAAYNDEHGVFLENSKNQGQLVTWENDVDGVRLYSSDHNFDITSTLNNAGGGTGYNVHINANDNDLDIVANAGTNVDADLRVAFGLENKIRGTWRDESISSNADRTLLHGWGKNAGDPNSTGQWNGNGYEGAAVVDTTNGTKYVYRGGSWV